jgi:hypothetical protein
MHRIPEEAVDSVGDTSSPFAHGLTSAFQSGIADPQELGGFLSPAIPGCMFNAVTSHSCAKVRIEQKTYARFGDFRVRMAVYKKARFASDDCVDHSPGPATNHWQATCSGF